VAEFSIFIKFLKVTLNAYSLNYSRVTGGIVNINYFYNVWVNNTLSIFPNTIGSCPASTFANSHEIISKGLFPSNLGLNTSIFISLQSVIPLTGPLMSTAGGGVSTGTSIAETTNAVKYCIAHLVPAIESGTISNVSPGLIVAPGVV
jgi:hypothetical protein